MINRRITLIGPEGTNLYIVFQFILFNVISWFTLYTSIESLEFNLSNLLFRQIIFSTIGIGIFFLTTYISINQVAELSFFFILVSTILLFGLLLTEPIVGVNRWYSLEAIGIPVFLQISEFSKVFVVAYLARVLSGYENRLIGYSLIFLNIILIFLQPDLGTSFLFVSVVFCMLFLTNIKFKQIFLISICLILLFFIFLELDLLGQYQIDRITSFFTGEDFSQQQSRLSISSGGITGTYIQESLDLNVFVPVQSTDFIFSLYAKNFGLVGTVVLFLLWFLFIFRVLIIIQQSELIYEKFLLSGVILMLSIQILINLTTVLGIIPLTGIPFPLLSLGGSSVISTSILFGLINRAFIENNIVI
jgi:cell division protein FtsW (lipid II flippase)